MSQSASDFISIECRRIAIFVGHIYSRTSPQRPSWVVMGGMGVTWPAFFGGVENNIFILESSFLLLLLMIILPL